MIGGGVGGLTAALSLLELGFDVRVFEQAARISEVGAGIQVSPNASRVLHGLGLADALAAMGVRPLAFHQRRWDDGRTLLRAPLGDVIIEAFGFPHYQTHRADLLSALVGALPRERLQVGHRLVALTQRADHVQASFENGVRVEVDLLIGADGIHSFVREALLGRQARISLAVSRTAVLSRPRGCTSSSSRSPRSFGWGLAAISSTTSCRTSVW